MKTSAPSGLNRRKFIKAGSVAIGGAALGNLAIERSAFAKVDDTLKIALIGCGGRGAGAASQALTADAQTELIAMADAFKDRLDSSLSLLKEQHSARVKVPPEHQFIGFDGYKKAISLADVVILATPPGFRPAHFEEAVNQGKHVFMEKPLAVDAPGVRKILAAAKKAKEKNLKVGVGLQRRHDAGYIETIKRLQDGMIGYLVAMRAYWNTGEMWCKKRKDLESEAGRKLTEMEYQMRNWYYFTWLSGDHIVEQHIHNMDVINWVKGMHPVRAYGIGGREVREGPDYGEIFDHHTVEFEYPDGTGSLSQCRQIPGCWEGVSEFARGTQGSADISRNMIGADVLWRYDRKVRDPYQQEQDDLFAAIRKNLPYNEAEYGAEATMTAIMGRMSSYSGKIFEWDQALNSEISLMPKVLAWDAKPPVLPGPNGLYPCAVPGKTITV